MDSWMWILVISALSLCLYYYFRKKQHNFQDWGIPQMWEVPFVGMLGNNLIRRWHITDMTKAVYELNKDAKYVGMHTLMSPSVVVRDIELVKAVLIKDFDHFIDRQASIDGSANPLFTKNLLFLNGDRWREMRNMLSPAFTASKMRMMFELMLECAENFTTRFMEKFADQEETDVKDAFTRYTNDVIATCAFGIEIDSLKDPNNEFYLYGVKITNPDGLSQIVQIFKFIFIATFPKLSQKLNIKLMDDKMVSFFVNIIDSAVKLRDESGIERPDMLQLMINAREKHNLDIMDMTAQAFIFFAAGFETASTHMSLMAYEMAVNQDVQEKLFAEVDGISKATNGKVTYEAIANMPYFDAVFQETLRLHPPVALLGRICTKDYELPPTLPGARPYLMKPGAEIVVPAAAIHKDPVFYEQPDKFDPERFVGKKITAFDTTNLGFGLGPRMCIGNRFAILETKVLFFHLLNKCSFHPSKKTTIPMKYSKKKLSPTPADGFWLRVKRR